jgi:hypothetical protein
MSNQIEKAFEVIKKEMILDPWYAWSWHCNIAVCAQDSGLDHASSNEAAARFMSMCFGVDTSKEPTSSNLNKE